MSKFAKGNPEYGVEDQPKEQTAMVKHDYSRFQNQGMEDAPALAPPRLKVLQGDEPETIMEAHPLKGKAGGLIWNTRDNSTSPTAMLVPCYMRRVYQQWESLKPGGKPPMATFLKKPEGVKWVADSGLMAEDGTYISETHHWFCLLGMNSKPWQPVWLTLARTALTVSRKWHKEVKGCIYTDTKGKELEIPPFAQTWGVQGIQVPGKSKVWWGWQFARLGDYRAPSDATFINAHAFYIVAKEYCDGMDIAPADSILAATERDDIPF